MDVFDYLSIILAVSAIVLHCTGLYLLWKARKAPLSITQGSKPVFIAHFSCWCLVWAINNIIRYPLMQIKDEKLHAYWLITVEGSRIPFYIGVLLITYDRFCQLYFHLNYEACYIYKYKLVICLMVFGVYLTWLATALAIYDSDPTTLEVLLKISSYYITVMLQGFLILSFAFVYSYIIRKTLIFTSSHTPRRRQLWRRLTIPALIMGTFLIFEVFPDLSVNLGIAEYGSWVIFLFRFDTNLKALTYIFMQPTVRKRLRVRFRHVVKWSLSNQIHPIRITVSNRTTAQTEVTEMTT